MSVYPVIIIPTYCLAQGIYKGIWYNNRTTTKTTNRNTNMFTLKIIANGSIFIRPCSEAHIITNDGETYEEECLKLKADYVASGVLPDSDFCDDCGVSIEVQREHKLEEMMPYAFLFYETDGKDGSRMLYDDDQAFIVNEQGKTIQAVREPRVLSIAEEECQAG